MAVRTRAVHTLADRDFCSNYSSVSISHVADDVAKLRAERETLNRLAAIADQSEPNPV